MPRLDCDGIVAHTEYKLCMNNSGVLKLEREAWVCSQDGAYWWESIKHTVTAQSQELLPREGAHTCYLSLTHTDTLLQLPASRIRVFILPFQRGFTLLHGQTTWLSTQVAIALLWPYILKRPDQGRLYHMSATVNLCKWMLGKCERETVPALIHSLHAWIMRWGTERLYSSRNLPRLSLSHFVRRWWEMLSICCVSL